MKNRVCTSCGVEFQANGPRKYCDECQNKSTAAFYAARVKANRHNAGDHMSACAMCGKEGYNPNGYHPYYCSKGCHDRANTLFARERARCPVCGVRLASKGLHKSQGYCSEECRLEQARRDGRAKSCPVCGKEFVPRNKTQQYCSSECKASTRPKGKRQYVHLCEQCGKLFMSIRKGQRFCDRVCVSAFKKTEREHQAALEASHNNTATKVEKSVSEIKVEKTESKKIPTQVATARQGNEEFVHLCTQCRTSQFECMRFRSNFQYLPEGASWKLTKSGKKVLGVCPQYTAPKSN